jgi:hypothetical protein
MFLDRLCDHHARLRVVQLVEHEREPISTIGENPAPGVTAPVITLLARLALPEADNTGRAGLQPLDSLKKLLRESPRESMFLLFNLDSIDFSTALDVTFGSLLLLSNKQSSPTT